MNKWRLIKAFFIFLGSFTFVMALLLIYLLFDGKASDRAASIHLPFADQDKTCGDFSSGVTAITTVTRFDTTDFVIGFKKLQNYLRRQFNEEKEYKFTYQYDMTSFLQNDNKNLQNITIEVPKYIHENLSYGLSCKLHIAPETQIQFREFKPRVKNHNYAEAATHTLPYKCHSATGEITLNIKSHDGYSLIYHEAQNAIIRAALWDTSAKTPHNASLDLYLSQMSFAPSETIDIYAHSRDELTKTSLEIFRMGSAQELIGQINDLSLSTQYVTAYSFRDGVNWDLTAQFKLPDTARSGYYMAVIKQSDKFKQFPFIVSPAQDDHKKRIALIAATNTWQAYNPWGNGSFYSNQIGNQCLGVDFSPIISTKRPLDDPYLDDLLGETREYVHLFPTERYIPAWMEANNYRFDAYADTDLHNIPNLLNDYDIVVLPTHPEYYSKKMYDALEHFQQRGGSIIYLGGNALYYRIAVKDHNLEKHENGRIFDLDEGRGGKWSFLNDRSPAKLLGVEYDARDYNSYMPYEVKNASHPLFNGTGLKNGDLFADKGSGLEMDVITQDSPDQTTLLAKGTNYKGYGGDMIVFDTPYGGKVFSAGAISFTYAMERDARAQKLIQNVFEDFLQTK